MRELVESHLGSLIAGIPACPGFLTVAELDRATALQATGGAENLVIGSSAGGRPITALRIGDGPVRVLAYGFPHANEPGGGVTLDYLAGTLARDPDLVRALGCTWYLTKCVDPDSARRNEGWFKGPFSPLNYTFSYYRQPGPRQVEWGFPIDYKALKVSDPIPEVVALRGLIDRVSPHVMISLHNSNMGGAYYWLLDSIPVVERRLAEATISTGIPLHLGEPEHMMALPLGPGVYRWVAVSELYDYFERTESGDAAALSGMGASSHEYARAVAGSISLIIETPLFSAPVISDTRPSGISRRQAALDEIADSRRFYSFLHETYEEIADELPGESRTASSQTFDRLLDTLRAREIHITRDSSFDREATVAEASDRLHLRRLNRMLPAGTFVRVVQTRIVQLERQSPGSSLERLRQARDRLINRLRDEARMLDRTVEYHATPIRDAAAQQLTAMITLVDQIQSGVRGGPS